MARLCTASGSRYPLDRPPLLSVCMSGSLACPCLPDVHVDWCTDPCGGAQELDRRGGSSTHPVNGQPEHDTQAGYLDHEIGLLANLSASASAPMASRVAEAAPPPFRGLLERCETPAVLCAWLLTHAQGS